jgi:large subunit ribosomal protein L32e
LSYRRPRFVREESWRYKRVKEAWRAPHGKTSRVRRSKKGWPAVVKIGYGHPRAIRGLHPSGLKEITVWRPKDLIGVDPKLHVIRIGHTVGENKRVQIIDEAKKANIRILNPGLKKPAETLPAAPAEPSVEAPSEPAAEPKTQEGTEAKAEEPSRPKPKKKAKPKTKTRRKSKK